MALTDELLANAARHAEGFAHADLQTPPSRHLAVITCMDSRIDVFALLGLGVGEAHVIRNAGGYMTEDVLRSLIISQRALGTRTVMLIHHTACGMTGLDDSAFRAGLAAETGVTAPWRVEGHSNPESAVREALVTLRTSPLVPYRDEIRGFVYDVATGLLSEVDA